MRGPSGQAWISILLLGSTLVLAVTGVFLFERGRQYYLELNESRLDPLGLKAFGDELPDRSLPIVVFYGDSRAVSWPALNQVEDATFLNRGIGAQTTAQVFGRFDVHIEPLKPDIIIVQAGINDLKTIPLFPERKQLIITDCQTNLNSIVTRSTVLGARVILTTIFPVGDVPLVRQPFWSPEVAAAVATVNDFLFTLESENVRVFDSYALLARNGQLAREFAQDELHLNAEGYAALNAALAPLLEAELKR